MTSATMVKLLNIDRIAGVSAMTLSFGLPACTVVGVAGEEVAKGQRRSAPEAFRAVGTAGTQKQHEDIENWPRVDSL